MKLTPYFELNGNRYEFKTTRWLIAEYEKLGKEMEVSAEDKTNALTANNLMADAKRFAEKRKRNVGKTLRKSHTRKSCHLFYV